jgi:DNA repair protein RecN (Recombination protein N)
MLKSLNIKNVVIIDALTLEFENGYCALTGETGAGKSILLDSLSLALGGRSDVSLIRRGKTQASVVAEFEVNEGHPVNNFLQECGIEVDTQVILRRLISDNGKSRAYINDEPVNIKTLKATGQYLVEIHGQFDTQGLLDSKNHRQYLDSFADVSCEEINSLWDTWKSSEQKLAEELRHIDNAQKEEEYVRSSLDDLIKLNPQENEEHSLTELRETLMKREKILEILSNTYAMFSETQGSIGSVWRSLEQLGTSTESVAGSVERINSEIQELLLQIQSLTHDLEYSDYSLDDIEERLFSLRDQARKHDCSVDELITIKLKLEAQLESLEDKDAYIDSLNERVKEARNSYLDEAKRIKNIRKEAAKDLSSRVLKELTPLKLEKANVIIDVTDLEEQDWGPYGMDKVRFLVSTNPGSIEGPISKIASGGELARFTLALKVVLSQVETEKTMVFDEVDSGISGPTAAAVGERLAALAKNAQILVITHSPQVAARADHHWLILKEGEKEVKTNVVRLADLDMREREVARMLSGTSVTMEARAAANKLINSNS